MLALFASLFGARAVDATEHHPGMVLAIAAESVVKFVALLCVAIFALTQLDGVAPLLETARRMPEGVDHSISFVTQTLLSLTAIFCLPRQFQIGVVECADVGDVRHARWWFSIYLALISVVVVPIAAAAIAAGERRQFRPIPLYCGCRSPAAIDGWRCSLTWADFPPRPAW